MVQDNAAKPVPGHINVPRLMAELSDILSAKYNMKITITARPKNAELADIEPVSA